MLFWCKWIVSCWILPPGGGCLPYIGMRHVPPNRVAFWRFFPYIRVLFFPFLHTSGYVFVPFIPYPYLGVRFSYVITFHYEHRIWSYWKLWYNDHVSPISAQNCHTSGYVSEQIAILQGIFLQKIGITTGSFWNIWAAHDGSLPTQLPPPRGLQHVSPKSELRSDSR